MKMSIKDIVCHFLRMLGYEIVNVKIAKRRYVNYAQDLLVRDAILHNTKERANDFYTSQRIKDYLEPKRICFYREVLNAIDCVAGDKVLDLGCGLAYLLRLLSQKKNICAFALDQADAVKEFVERSVPGVKFSVGDIYSTGYPNDFFDIVLCTEVLEHLLYPIKAMNEILRITQNSGKILITVPDGRMDTFLGHINFWSLESFGVFLETYVNKPIVRRLDSGDLMAILVKDLG